MSVRNRLLAIGLAILAASTAPACGQVTPVAPATATISIADARSLSNQAEADIEAHAFARLSTMVEALERALANPDTPLAVKGSPALYIDGDAERAAMRARLASPEGRELAARSPVLIDDPYPSIAWALGFYYNEVEKTDDAVRVLNTGLASLKATHLQPALAENAPFLGIEIGAALNTVGEWQKAHDAYQMVLLSPDRTTHAQAYRGIGFSLIELERLDDAETAFRQALRLEPDSESTKWELDYIAHLRRGGAKQDSSAIIETSRQPHD
jgi:tetratricopeptide (TPR) repeat protein